MARILRSCWQLASRSSVSSGSYSRFQGFRGFSSAEEKGGSSPVLWILGLGAVGGGAYYYSQGGSIDELRHAAESLPGLPVQPPVKDYTAVRGAIASLLDAENYDDGSYAPVLVRLAWHASGTYDKASGTGGSYGANMRFDPEASHGANAGLDVARSLLEPVKKQFPWITYADLWTLAGVVAIEEMGGPVVPWRAGREDSTDGTHCTPDGRLPDGDKGASHVRDIFYRMGFTDQEIVALLGAHSVGRCHPDRSGWDGPWTNAPTTFSNLYFKELTDNKWTKKKWSGPLQYEDRSKQLMMLPSDMALVWDRGFRKFVEQYAKDEDKFFADFASAFSKLLELGVPFPEPSPA